MIEEWDADEEAKEIETYLSKDKGADAIYHMMRKYWRSKGIKLDPAKQSKEEVWTSISNTIYYDKEFHKFVLENYGLIITYDEKNHKLEIRK